MGWVTPIALAFLAGLAGVVGRWVGQRILKRLSRKNDPPRPPDAPAPADDSEDAPPSDPLSDFAADCGLDPEDYRE